MSDCGICIETGGDDDSTEFLNERIVKARKPHRCCECHRTIPIGALYEVAVGKWGNHFDSYHTCLVCREIRHAFCCHGWTYTLLWRDFSEYFEHLTTACLNELATAAAKAYLLERWQAWKFER